MNIKCGAFASTLSILPLWSYLILIYQKQECFPVGCVPPTLVTVSPARTPPPLPGTHAPLPHTPCHISLPHMSPCHAYSLCHACLPWTEWLSEAFENITLPQTSFAGGKDVWYICVSIIYFLLVVLSNTNLSTKQCGKFASALSILSLWSYLTLVNYGTRNCWMCCECLKSQFIECILHFPKFRIISLIF